MDERLANRCVTARPEVHHPADGAVHVAHATDVDVGVMLEREVGVVDVEQLDVGGRAGDRMVAGVLVGLEGGLIGMD